jgi:hypothetical protein
MKQIKARPVLGWREWVALPDLGIQLIKAKVDTGARTSALNATSMEEFVHNGKGMVRFEVFISGIKHSSSSRFFCNAPVVDSREVTNSGGHREHRIVISTRLQLGLTTELVEITLTNRGSMKFPMLIGRSAIRRRYLVNPGRSYLAGKPGVGKLDIG